MLKRIRSVNMKSPPFFVPEKVVNIFFNVFRNKIGILQDILKFHREKYFKKQ